jgi:hypothetical protein
MILFASRPLKDLKIHRYALCLRKSPWNYLDFSIWPSGALGGAACELPARSLPERVGEGEERA